MKRILLLFFACPVYLAAQDLTGQLQSVDQKLSSGKSGTSEILCDKQFMTLHPVTGFRELIRKYAKPGKVNIAPDGEPGERISVMVAVNDAQGKPLRDALVYVYQTSDKGWYSDTAAHVGMNEGDRRHARLFGYVRTGEDGRFGLATIKPRGYPQSTLPAHIHIEVSGSNNESLVSELLFADDLRMVGETRSRAVNEGFYISKNTGTADRPVYSYSIKAN